jgi:hypothetical protein
MLTSDSIFAIGVNNLNVARNEMNPVIGQCPICGNHLHVTRLQCRNCDTTIDGHFTLGRLYQLSPEQLEFVETFLRCEGKINRVEQEIGLSYPAVRARLNDVIRALGYEVGETAPAGRGASEEVRREVLSELRAGKLSAEEALQILRGDSD